MKDTTNTGATGVDRQLLEPLASIDSHWSHWNDSHWSHWNDSHWNDNHHWIDSHWNGNRHWSQLTANGTTRQPT